MDSYRIDDPDGSPVVGVTVDRDESASGAVVRAVAAVTNSPPTDLPPLYDAIDPDALNAVVRTLGTDGRVVFQYSGYTIAVDAGATVEVYDGG